MLLLDKNIQNYLPLNLEKMLNLTVYTLASANIGQSAPNLVTIYMTIRYWMGLIMGPVRLEEPELFALELLYREIELLYLTWFTL